MEGVELLKRYKAIIAFILTLLTSSSIAQTPSQNSKKIPNIFVCKGERTTNFGIPPQMLECEFAIEKTSAENVTIRFRKVSTSNSSACLLSMLKGNNPESRHNKTEKDWDVISFPKNEDYRTYAMGQAVEKISYTETDKDITLFRYNSQPTDTLTWVMKLVFERTSNQIAFTHSFVSMKGKLENRFVGTCVEKR